MILSVMIVGIASVNAEITTPGGNGESIVTLDVTARNLKATVPSVLPIDVDSDNNVTVATNAKISNLSDGPIEVSNVAVDPQSNWTIVPFATDFTKVPVDTKQYGMTMYNDDVVDGVPVSLFDVIEGDSELAVVYDGNVAIQSNAYNKLDIGHVVFTVSWATNNSKSELLEYELPRLTLMKAPVAQPKKLFADHSLLLNGNIGLNFFIDPSAVNVDIDDLDTAVVRFVYDEPTANSQYDAFVSEFDLKDVVPDSRGYYMATCDVAAGYMAHDIHAEVYFDGVLQNETDSYSIQDYAQTILSDPVAYTPADKDSDALVSLVKEMLNYGSKVQDNFSSQMNSTMAYNEIPNYTMQDVSVTDVTDAIQAANNGQSGATIEDLRNIGTAIGGQWYTTTVIFMNNNTIKHYFDDADENGMETAGATKVNDSDWIYYIEQPNIAAADLDTLYTFSIGSQTFKFSVLDYVIAMLNSNAGDSAKALVKAVYLYNQAANTYFD